MPLPVAWHKDIAGLLCRKTKNAPYGAFFFCSVPSYKRGKDECKAQEIQEGDEQGGDIGRKTNGR